MGPEFSGAGSLAATPIGQVLPGIPASIGAVVDGQFRPRVTDLGQRHPVTEGLAGANPPAATRICQPSWGSWYRRISRPTCTARCCCGTRDGQPLLLLDRVGKGRVALLLSDQIWLWSRGHQGGGPQAELLRRVAHWLMQEPELEENALTARVADGRLTIERRSTDPAPPGQVTVTDPDGKTADAEPDRDRDAGHGDGRAAGHHARSVAGERSVPRTAYAAAGAANPPELADLRATATLLRKLARASGAACISSAPASRKRRRMCRSCGGPSPTGRPQADPGSGWSGGTTMWSPASPR